MIKYRKKEYTNIEGLIGYLKTKIKEHQESIEHARKLIAAVQVTPVTKEQKMLLKYIETRSTPKTAKFMREQGVTAPSGNSFQPSDVTDFINADHDKSDIDPILVDYAKVIFRGNKKAALRFS